MLMYELLNFNGLYEHEANQIRANFRAFPVKVRWLEWKPEMKRIVETPDLSIISARNMRILELNKVINAASSTNIILYGGGARSLGHPCVDGQIELEMLEEFFGKFSPSVAPEDAKTLNRWANTVPMPLPIR